MATRITDSVVDLWYSLPWPCGKKSAQEDQITRLMARACCARDDEDFSRLARASTQILSLNPNHEDALYMQACALAHQKYHELAINLFSRFITAYPKNENIVNATMLRAICYKKSEQFDMAIADCTTVLEKSPKASYIRARCLQKQGDFDKAVDDFCIASEQLPDMHQKILMNKAKCHFAGKVYDLAIQELDQYIATNMLTQGCVFSETVDYQAAILFRSKCHLAAKNYDKVIEDASKIKYWDLSAGSFLIAEACMERKQYKSAIDNLVAITNSEFQGITQDTVTRALELCGTCHMALKEYPEAIECYKSLLCYNDAVIASCINGKNDKKSQAIALQKHYQQISSSDLVA